MGLPAWQKGAFGLAFVLTLVVDWYISNSSSKSADYVDYLFKGLGFEIDPHCRNRDAYYYRSFDGSCNWLKKGQYEVGKAWTMLGRDHPDVTYADGISQPRKGPNSREVANAFWNPKDHNVLNHTAFLPAVVQLLVHDVVWTMDDRNDMYKIPIPKGDHFFDPKGTGNVKLKFWRNLAVNGTGTSKANPREQYNGVSSWIDMSPIYGNTREVNAQLRTFENGKMKVSKGPDGGDYMPWNTMKLPMMGHGRLEDMFAAGDQRANQDWLVIAFETLLLREHNRLCDVLVEMYKDWDDKKLFEGARVILGAKVLMALNSYQIQYFTPEMAWPTMDGYPLFRKYYDKSVWEINPAHLYPWKYAMKNGVPQVASQEMSIGYRFHELVPTYLPVINKDNETVANIGIVANAYNASGFMNTGMDDFYRGMIASVIQGFHSGDEKNLRNMKFSLSEPDENTHGFDIAMWDIERERERGLPTFNQYFRETYNGKVPCKPRKTFEEFTTNPEHLANLKRLYSHPDEVDLLVGLQLDETLFPGTIIPTSKLILSIINLFAIGESDRFSPRSSLLRCIVDQPFFNCHPSNILDEIMWPSVSSMFPNFRRPSKFWIEEMGLKTGGMDVLRKLVIDNTNVKCLQKNPFVTSHPTLNPIVCNE